MQLVSVFPFNRCRDDRHHVPPRRPSLHGAIVLGRGTEGYGGYSTRSSRKPTDARAYSGTNEPLHPVHAVRIIVTVQTLLRCGNFYTVRTLPR